MDFAMSEGGKQRRGRLVATTGKVRLRRKTPASCGVSGGTGRVESLKDCCATVWRRPALLAMLMHGLHLPLPARWR